MVNLDLRMIRRFADSVSDRFDIIVTRPISCSLSGRRRVFRVSVGRLDSSCLNREIREFVFGADALDWLISYCA